MDKLNHIIDTKLPLTQDFKSLRKEGLAFIQENIGEEWTNMNASDPGVTILDQVCYALTELGYCNDFDIKDILTGSNGKLQLSDQFYLPENILTTSPVSLTDYVRYLVDGVEYVKNAVIAPAMESKYSSCNIYQSYLSIDPSLSDDAKKDVLKAAFYYLNKSRNVGELFLDPQLFTPSYLHIKGDVEIADQAQSNTVRAAINNAIRNYIFPDVIQTGYQQLVADGLSTNEIFDGPLLLHGWIPNENLGTKRDQVNIIELTGVMSNIPGVKAVADVQFVNKGTDSPVKPAPGVLLVVDTSRLNFVWPGSATNKVSAQSSGVVKPMMTKGNIQLGASVQVQTNVPVGKYRDINNYYSIQNTFPDIFAVGADTTVSNATDFQIAQSRQLKGYLTLFDQVLANQFSQLANVGQLFSFKNAMTGTPSDEQEYYAIKNAFEKEHSEYPVPYEVFSPTYFYQSLYDIPHIRPLLKGNDAFKFSTTIETEREFEHLSWQAFTQDPYNLYMRGLMEFAEEQSESINRRNAILDHLLARHGESPEMMDMIIDGSVYTGNSLKDRVIFKSLYLQNLGLLSYYRQKAYNYLGADKIPTKMEDVPMKLDNKLFYITQRDFTFDSEQVNAIEKLTGHDFINYSAVELKLSMLFGLKTQYRDFIIHQGTYANKKLAFWLITRRKGLIFLEMDLLLQDAFFEIFFSYKGSSDGNTIYEHIDKKLNYREMLAITQLFQQNTGNDLGKMLANSVLKMNGVNYYLVSAPGGEKNNRYRPIPNTDYSFTVRTDFQQNFAGFENDVIFNNRMLAIFPSFIDQFKEIIFQQRLSFFFQNDLPLQITCGCSFVNGSTLEELIPAFTAWHNALIHHEKQTSQIVIHQPQYYAALLARLINDINPEPND